VEEFNITHELINLICMVLFQILHAISIELKNTLVTITKLTIIEKIDLISF